MDFKEIKNTWKSSFVAEEIGEAEIEKMLKVKQKANTALGKIKRSYINELVLSVFLYLGIIGWLVLNIKTFAVLIIIGLLTILSGAFFQYTLRVLLMIC